MAPALSANRLTMAKQLLWGALLASATASAGPECVHISRELYVDGWEVAHSKEVIYRRITPQAVVNCRYLPDQGQKLNVLARYEQGVLNGAEYKLHYTDGSAVIQGERDKSLQNAGYTETWRLVCKTAQPGNSRSCTLNKGDIHVRKDSDGTLTLDIGENRRAKSQVLLRVDTNWAVTTEAENGFSPDQTNVLVEQMKHGRQADTSYQDASRHRATDKTTTLFGFSQALDILDNVLGQLNTPPAGTP